MIAGEKHTNVSEGFQLTAQLLQKTCPCRPVGIVVVMAKAKRRSEVFLILCCFLSTIKGSRVEGMYQLGT